jgi:two-component system phosphate regulon sensor histidine kinase PhoR
LNQHIEKILYVAKTDSNQIALEKTKVDVQSLLELVKENIQLKHAKEIQIRIAIEKPFTLLADEFHCYNLIYNLIDNAVKYTESSASIEINAKETAKGLLIEFIDHGIGIPEKDLPFVFDKFYRVARQDNKDIEGFGIGLSYVKRVCEWHKWNIGVKNNEEQGITVSVEINKNDYE